MKRILIFMFLTGVLLMSVNSIHFPQMDGWKPVGDVKTYRPDNLHEYTAAAGNFISYGFQELKSQHFKQDDRMVTLYIYDMGTPLNAYGLYKAQQKNTGLRKRTDADSTVFSPFQHLMFKDRFCVKIESCDGEIDNTLAVTLLKAVTLELPGRNGLPKQLSDLPEADKVADSEGFAINCFLGLNELKNCVYAEYGGRANSYKIFRIVDNGAVKADDAWRSLASSWQSMKNGIQYRVLPSGLVGIKKTGNGYIGISNCKDRNDLIQKFDKIS